MVLYPSINLLADTLITLTMLGQIVPLKDTEHCLVTMSLMGCQIILLQEL